MGGLQNPPESFAARMVANSVTSPISAPDRFPHTISQLRCLRIIRATIWGHKEGGRKRRALRGEVIERREKHTCLTFLAERSPIFCSRILSTYYKNFIARPQLAAHSFSNHTQHWPRLANPLHQSGLETSCSVSAHGVWALCKSSINLCTLGPTAWVGLTYDGWYVN